MLTWDQNFFWCEYIFNIIYIYIYIYIYIIQFQRAVWTKCIMASRTMILTAPESTWRWRRETLCSSTLCSSMAQGQTALKASGRYGTYFAEICWRCKSISINFFLEIWKMLFKHLKTLLCHCFFFTSQKRESWKRSIFIERHKIQGNVYLYILCFTIFIPHLQIAFKWQNSFTTEWILLLFQEKVNLVFIIYFSTKVSVYYKLYWIICKWLQENLHQLLII